jgi:hypothetical protein
MRNTIVVVVTLWASIGTGRTDAAEVFWNDDTGIQVFDPWGGVPQSSLFQTFENRGIALDENDGRISWSDVLPLGAPGSAGVIRQGRTGSFATIASGLPRPAGVAFDHRSGMVYWTDLGDGAHPSAVYSASRDGSDPKSIISGPWLAEMSGIALDAVHNHLYFSYINPLIDAVLTGGIARADLDGKNVQPIVGGLGKPIGVAVYPEGNRLFWTDASRLPTGVGGAEDQLGRIEAATLDGQNPQLILGGLNTPFGIALDLEHQHVYWTDTGTGKIQRTTMSGELPYFEDVLTGLENPTALAIRSTSVSPLPGDANGDRQVDHADLAVLVQNYGRSDGGVLWSDGDFDRDQIVALGDLTILRSHWTALGRGVQATAAHVPEPAAIALIAVALVALGCKLRLQTVLASRPQHLGSTSRAYRSCADRVGTVLANAFVSAAMWSVPRTTRSSASSARSRTATSPS